MTFNTFIAKYGGHYVDWDHAYGYQCVDLMRQYVWDVIGLKPYIAIPSTGNAKDIYKNYHGTAFQKIPNTPLGIPKDGDIIFWGFYPGVTGWAGHVAVVVGTGGSVNNFISFDQNWPTNSACHRQLHNYRGVLGWLRKV